MTDSERAVRELRMTLGRTFGDIAAFARKFGFSRTHLSELIHGGEIRSKDYALRLIAALEKWKESERYRSWSERRNPLTDRLHDFGRKQPGNLARFARAYGLSYSHLRDIASGHVKPGRSYANRVAKLLVSYQRRGTEISHRFTLDEVQRADRLRGSGKTWDAIAEAMGRDRKSVSGAVRRYRRGEFSGFVDRVKREREEIETMIASGMSIPEIASALGCRPKSLWSRLRDMGFDAETIKEWQSADPIPLAA